MVLCNVLSYYNFCNVVQYYILKFVLNIRRKMSFYCCCGNQWRILGPGEDSFGNIINGFQQLKQKSSNENVGLVSKDASGNKYGNVLKNAHFKFIHKKYQPGLRSGYSFKAGYSITNVNKLSGNRSCKSIYKFKSKNCKLKPNFVSRDF